MKILFVCLGNICRSPLAEALFMHKIAERGLAGKWSAASCGTANYHVGEPPDPRTLANASENGIAIHHLGRQLAPSDLWEFDRIVAMDRSNRQNIMRLPDASKYAGKIFMMRDFDPLGAGKDVPDPWSGNEQDFQEVFEILDRSVSHMIDELVVDKH